MQPKLRSLRRKAERAALHRVTPVAGNETVRPPKFIRRTAFADAVSQLFHAERATERMCHVMAGRMQTPDADALLGLQAGDENHHADLYRSYLARIGDIRPPDPRISDALEMLLDRSLGDEAVLAGYNVVLEGEALKLQQDTIERFSCPALGRITRAVARDEARHVFFGHALLSKRLPMLDRDHRFEIYRHIHDCWKIAAAAPPGNANLFGALLTRKRAAYMDGRWACHHAALQRIGLIRRDERAPL